MHDIFEQRESKIDVIEAFISYEGLPIKSGGAHSLGAKSVDKIYLETTTFLENFTTSNKPKEIDLTFYSSQNKTYKTLPILWDLIKKFGIPSFGKWNLGTTKQRFFSWRLKNDVIDKGFQILEAYKDLQENAYGPIVLSFLWHFHFTEQSSSNVLSGQDAIPVIDERQHNSQLYLRLSHISTISVWFAFPFNSLDNYASKYIQSLAKFLPFKLSEKHWRIWHRSTKGNWISKKLELNFNGT